MRASIWENAVEKDGKTVTLHTVQIERAYQQDGQWKHTNRYAARDLPKLVLVAQKAFEFLSLKGQKENEEV